MKPIEIVAQVISILAMTFNILSYQRKTQRGIITFQFFGGAFFAVSFLLLGSVMGTIMNVVAVLRAAVYRERERLHADHILWLFGFVTIFLLSYLLSFTAFGTDPTPKNFAIELFPVIGMTVSTVSFRMKGARIVRFLGLISSPSWLVYNIFVGSIGATLCEAISIVSILVGIVRYDIRKKDEKPTE